MKKKLQIFISSTYTDLIEERQAAVSAILKAGHIPAGMELFTAGNESQMETIKRWIDESDVFMLILGGRYGSIEPNTSLSYTELEYDYAIKTGKRCFAVVINEAALERKVKEQGTSAIETAHTQELAAFRRKVLSRISAFFNNVQDIRLAVFETILDFLERYDFKGWVSGDEIPDIQSFTDQINKLREENKRLVEDRNALQAGAVFAPSEETEFNHIRQKLDRNIRVSFDLYRKKGGAEPDVKFGDEVYTVNLLNLVIAFVKKGHHRFSKYGMEDLLYKNLNERQPLPAESQTQRKMSLTIINDNVVLELQTYGLNKFIEVDTYNPADSYCEFTEKMYRFAYWLDYKEFIPEISFEFVAVEERVVPREAQSTQENVPALKIIREIDRVMNFKAKRNRWRTTEEGVTSARQEVEKLCDELKRNILKSNSESELFKIDFTGKGESGCKMSGVGNTFWVNWRCEWPDTLDGSSLLITGEETDFEINGIRFTSNDEPGGVYGKEFDIDINKDSTVIWTNRKSRKSCTSGELAKILLTDFINQIHRRVAHTD